MGGGGGGGGTFHQNKPEELARRVRDAERKTSGTAFKAKISDMLSDLLGAFNSRDVALVRERLEDVKSALEGAIEGTIDQLFGGSVAKHTYVDGLSDVDSLVILNDTSLEDHSPRQALDFIRDVLAKKVDASVTAGRMAVTLQYGDGMQIQILPAVEAGSKQLRIPSSRREDAWSHIVDPAAFQEHLTSANQDCAGKLIPTIKLAKAINGTLPESQRLSGYHIESIGIAAFRGYDGNKTTADMLPEFFERASKLVLAPIVDRSGQSVHVDEYLGNAASSERVTAGHILSRIAKRMRNADAASSLAQWRALFELDD
jgi:Second Messenger Oligonucleotide or Dinucleotide Synthetase domain